MFCVRHKATPYRAPKYEFFWLSYRETRILTPYRAKTTRNKLVSTIFTFLEREKELILVWIQWRVSSRRVYWQHYQSCYFITNTTIYHNSISWYQELPICLYCEGRSGSLCGTRNVRGVNWAGNLRGVQNGSRHSWIVPCTSRNQQGNPSTIKKLRCQSL